MSEDDAIPPTESDDGAPVVPLIPVRQATPQQAIMAVALIFVVGIAIGFALARTI